MEAPTAARGSEHPGNDEQVAAIRESYAGRFLAPLLPKATARRATR